MTQGVFCHKRPLYYISPCKAFAKSQILFFHTTIHTESIDILLVHQRANEKLEKYFRARVREEADKKVTRNYCGCCCYCDCFASSCCYSCSCFMQQTLSATLPTDLLAQIHKKRNGGGNDARSPWISLGICNYFIEFFIVSTSNLRTRI